jgi:transposase
MRQPRAQRRPIEGAALRAMYVGEGLRIAEVARRLGVRDSTARDLLVAAGVDIRHSGVRPGAPVCPDRSALHAMYVEQRLPVKEMALQLAVPRQTVQFWLRKHRVLRRLKPDSGPRRPRSDAVARAYLDQGMSLAAMAQQFDVGVVTVKRWLTEGGIAIRSRGYSTSHGRRLSRPLDEQLRTWWVDERLTADAIADKFGVVASTVYRWLTRAGVNRPSAHASPFNPLVLERMYLEERMSVSAIAQELAASIQTVRGWLDEAGILVGRVQRPSRDTLRALYVDEGLSITETARRVGVRRTTVQRWLEEDHIAPRAGGGQQAKPRPSPMQLRIWYVNEHQSSKQIAQRCGVSYGTIGRWLRDAGVPLRRSGRGIEARGGTAPGADDLRRLVWKEHLPYRQIAEIYGCDTSAVRHWLIKHGIPRPTTWETIRKGNMVNLPTADELIDRYAAGESLKAIAKDYPVSWLTVRDLARGYGIEMRPPGWYLGPALICADGHQVRSAYEMRVDDWLTVHGLDHHNEPPMPFVSNWRADFLVGDTYIEVWGVTGRPAYDRKKEAKVAAFQKHKVRLLELPHWIFASKNAEVFDRRMAQLLHRA